MHTAIHRLCSLTVNDVMSGNVVTIPADWSMRQAAKHFSVSELSSAPVEDEDQNCVGFLSATDFMKFPSLQNGQNRGEMKVRDFMTSKVVSIGRQAPLLRAAEIMCRQHLHRLPVMEQGRIVGMISTMDIVAALMNALAEMEAWQVQPLDF